MSDNLQDKMDYFFSWIHEPDFLEQKGLANDIPYYIFDYDPKDEPLIREHIKWVMERSSLNIVEINLYKIVLELFDDIGVEALLEMEAEEGTKELYEAMQPTLEESELTSLIEERAEDAELIFITGVGNVYPLLRSHDVLSKLAEKKVHKPLIVFYPGRFNGLDFSLFNVFKNDNYYRAIRIATNR